MRSNRLRFSIVFLTLFVISLILFVYFLHDTNQSSSNIVSYIPTPRTQLAQLSGTGSGLVGWWKLDEGGGVIATDSSGNGNNGTLVGGANWVSGKIGQSVNLNGSNAYVSLPSISFTTSQNWSYAIWLKPSMLSGYQTIFGKKYFEYQLQLNGSNLIFDYFNPNGSALIQVGSAISSPNQWYLAVVTYDGRAANLYINGILVSTDNNIVGALKNSADPLLLGAGWNAEASSQSNQFFSGSVDDFRVYSRALSASDIDQLYSFGTSGNGTPATHALSIIMNGSGSGTVSCNGSTCPLMVNDGTSLTMTASPSSDSTLSSWGSACPISSASCTITVTADTTISVTFSLSQAGNIPLPPTPTGTCSVNTYYVDFDGGNDSNDGKCTGTAWKHAPGDLNATGNPASVSIKPGDTISFKGGVIYKGSLSLNYSGVSGNPITYRGDIWGSEKSIIDGSESLAGWLRCVSQTDCGGNSNWQNIYHISIKKPLFLDVTSWPLYINLYQDSTPLPASQFPLSSTVLWQTLTNYYSPTSVTDTSLVDSRLATLGGSNLIGSLIYLYFSTNALSVRKILSYDTVTNKITFASVGGLPIALWSVVNNIGNSVFKSPGQYYVSSAPKSNGEYELYVWPLAGLDLAQNSGRVTMSVRSGAINLNGKTNITVEGFKIQKQTGSDYGQGGAIFQTPSSSQNGNILIKDNEVTMTNAGSFGAIGMALLDNVTVENNYIHDIGGHNMGISLGLGSNLKVLNNTLEKISGTGIYLSRASNSSIIGNTVMNGNAVHANGISVYDGSNNIQISGNKVINSNIPLTVEYSSNYLIFNNVLDGQVSDWGGSSGYMRFFNNTVLSGLNLISKGYSEITIKNNILGGLCRYDFTNVIHTNNLYTSLCWQQDPAYKWSLGNTEFVNSATSNIFTGYVGKDFHLKVGSPAIGTGTNLSSIFSVDKDGVYRPLSGSWSIGAYEYTGSAQPAASYNPADTNKNWRINLNEIQLYAYCWKISGCKSVFGTNPMTIDYVNTASIIYKIGEIYHYDTTKTCPSCFVGGQY